MKAFVTKSCKLKNRIAELEQTAEYYREKYVTIQERYHYFKMAVVLIIAPLITILAIAAIWL